MQIDDVFDLLDDWRLLPDYQLERRADIFFALYLSEFLAAHLDVPVRPLLIPEFPCRFGTIRDACDSNQSCKIDFVALSKDGTRAFFIELKTDPASRNDKQNANMR